MKRKCKSIFPNHFRIKNIVFQNPGNLKIQQIPVQTFVDEGGLGKFYHLFRGEAEKIIEDINRELAA